MGQNPNDRTETLKLPEGKKQGKYFCELGGGKGFLIRAQAVLSLMKSGSIRRKWNDKPEETEEIFTYMHVSNKRH